MPAAAPPLPAGGTLKPEEQPCGAVPPALPADGGASTDGSTWAALLGPQRAKALVAGTFLGRAEMGEYMTAHGRAGRCKRRALLKLWLGELGCGDISAEIMSGFARTSVVCGPLTPRRE